MSVSSGPAAKQAGESNQRAYLLHGEHGRLTFVDSSGETVVVDIEVTEKGTHVKWPGPSRSSELRASGSSSPRVVTVMLSVVAPEVSTA